MSILVRLIYFFFNDTATTEIYTLSLHDALPILEEGGDDVKSSWPLRVGLHTCYNGVYRGKRCREAEQISQSTSKSDRKSTRLNSSHANISYAVFCLKKKKQNQIHTSFGSHSHVT